MYKNCLRNLYSSAKLNWIMDLIFFKSAIRLSFLFIGLNYGYDVTDAICIYDEYMYVLLNLSQSMIEMRTALSIGMARCCWQNIPKKLFMYHKVQPIWLRIGCVHPLQHYICLFVEIKKKLQFYLLNLLKKKIINWPLIINPSYFHFPNSSWNSFFMNIMQLWDI
jgi:hypothetical protein